MPASERRIVHEYLRERGDVETHSEGEEPERYLVVSPLRAADRRESVSRETRCAGSAPRDGASPVSGVHVSLAERYGLLERPASVAARGACWRRCASRRAWRRRRCADRQQAVDVHLADSLVALELEAGARGAADRRSRRWRRLSRACRWRWRCLQREVELVESQARKCEFIERVRAMPRGSTNASVVCTRVEEWPEGHRRATMSCSRVRWRAQPVVLEYAAPLAAAGGSRWWIGVEGATPEEELLAARRQSSWA